MTFSISLGTLVMGLTLMKQVPLTVFWVEAAYLINFK